MTGTTTSSHLSTKENMESLVTVGQDLLEKPASQVDPETGRSRPIPNLGTNADALKRLVHHTSSMLITVKLNYVSLSNHVE